MLSTSDLLQLQARDPNTLHTCVARQPGCDQHNQLTTVGKAGGVVFRYALGDTTGRDQAIARGLAMGIPEAQLDWRT